MPIPKDLSNLSYEQIMALLDSVNLPPQKNSGTKTPVTNAAPTPSNKKGSTPATTKSATEQPQSNKFGQRKPFQQTVAGMNQSMQAKKPTAGSFASAANSGQHSNRFMGSTFSGTNSNALNT